MSETQKIIHNKIVNILTNIGPKVDGLRKAYQINGNIIATIRKMKPGETPVLPEQSYYDIENNKHYHLTAKQWTVVENIKNEKAIVQKAHSGEYHTKLKLGADDNVLKTTIAELQPTNLIRLGNYIDVTDAIMQRTSQSVFKTKVKGQPVYADRLGWQLGKDLTFQAYKTLDITYNTYATAINGHDAADVDDNKLTAYTVIDSLLNCVGILTIFDMLDLEKTNSKFIKIYTRPEKNTIDLSWCSIPFITPEEGLIYVLLHIRKRIEEFLTFQKNFHEEIITVVDSNKEEKKKTVIKAEGVLKPNAPAFLKNFLEECYHRGKPYTITDLDNKLDHILRVYYKIVGVEAIECLTKCGYIYLETCYKKKRFLGEVVDPTSPKLVHFNQQIMLSIRRHTPQIIKSNSAKVLQHTLEDSINMVDNPYDAITVDTFVGHETQKDDATFKINNEKQLNDLFSTGYVIDKQAILEWLEQFERILTMPLDDIIKDPILLRFWGEVMEINFGTLLENKSTGAIKTALLDLLDYSRQFDTMALMTPPKQKIPTGEMEDLDVVKVISLIKTMQNILESRKFMLNEILFNITVMLNFNLFYYNYFVCFRGRVYPYGTFTYLTPLCRHFVGIYHSASTKDYPREDIPLLEYQIKALIKDHAEYFFKQETYISTNYIDIYDKLPFGKFFESITLIRDYLNCKFKVDSPYYGTYSLDCSSSGGQIQVMELKLYDLATQFSLLGNSDNAYVACANSLNDECTYHNDFIREIEQTPLNVAIKYLGQDINNNATVAQNVAVYLYLLEQPDMQDIINYLTLDGTTTLLSVLLFNKNSNGLMLVKFQAIMEKLKEALGVKLQAIARIRKNMLNKDDNKNPKKKKKVTQLDPNMLKYVIVNFVLIYISIKDQSSLTNKFPITTKVVKHPIMTHFYGSSFNTKKRQIYEYYVTNTLKTGVYLDKKQLRLLLRHSQFVARLLTQYVKKNFDQLTAIYDKIHKLCTDLLFKPIVIQSMYFTYSFCPFEVDRTKQRIGNATYWLLQKTKTVNYRKLATAQWANTVQHYDSELMKIFLTKIQQKLEQENCYVFTLHDRYFCHPIYARLLKPTLKETYIHYMSQNKLETHYADNPDIIQLIEKLRNKQKLFTPADLEANMNPDFVKH